MQENTKQTACAVLYGWGKRQIRQPSTWRGLALLATAAGVNISPDAIQAVLAMGVTVAGAIDVITNDSK